MDPRLRSARRLLPLVAVLVIATASVLPAAASAPVSTPSAPAAAAPAAAAPARADGRAGGHAALARPAARRAPSPSAAGARASEPVAVARTAIAVPAAQVKSESKAPVVSSRSSAGSGGSSASGGGGSAAPSSYRGTNHVWIPSLGISRSVGFYPCSRTSALAHIVYRWGCAGANNVYLMGHASSVFKPLHDAYISGRLRKGMKVIWADANGRVRTYAVSFWKLVRPDGDVGWAYAGQARPSMTLQTCVGANNQYRLVVRLAATG